ncbi:unnamed protein product [Effrenium voratum]|uniref:WW domain-containing protein n=1 Tax=Effrenium voratum TaxID=2562239 RepID=A0AA36JJH5_9DINO|nr:unnamed protein product [Effrenium voratum]
MNVHEQLPSQSLLPGAEIPKKTEQDAKFQNGEQGLPKSIGLMVEIRRLRLMEVVGFAAYCRGKIVRVVKFHPEAISGPSVVKLKEENLMYSAMREKEVQEQKEMPEGEIPNGTKVDIRGLQSDAAKWMNGQTAIVVCWDKDTDRYEVRLSVNNDVKKVKAANLRLEVPEGWQEHWDEHLGRYYYVNMATQKVTWKHPIVMNQRGKFGQVREKLDQDLEEVELDHERKHYEVDEEEEMEGQFNLQALVKKVEEQEARREAAEETGQDVDSDDGLHDIKPKKKKPKKEKVTAENIIEKCLVLIEHTFVARESIKKDYHLLDGNVCARDLTPLIQKWEALESASDAPDSLCKETFEVMLALILRGAELLKELSVNRLQLSELNKAGLLGLTSSEAGAEDCDMAIRQFLRPAQPKAKRRRLRPMYDTEEAFLEGICFESPASTSPSQGSPGPEAEDDLVTAVARSISLQDPFTLQLIESPARGRDCEHIQAFDRRGFLDFNELMEKNRWCRLTKKWKCPFCGKHISRYDLVDAKDVQEVLDQSRKLGVELTHAVLQPDGTLALPASRPPTASKAEAVAAVDTSSDEEAPSLKAEQPRGEPRDQRRLEDAPAQVHDVREVKAARSSVKSAAKASKKGKKAALAAAREAWLQQKTHAFLYFNGRALPRPETETVDVDDSTKKEAPSLKAEQPRGEPRNQRRLEDAPAQVHDVREVKAARSSVKSAAKASRKGKKAALVAARAAWVQRQTDAHKQGSILHYCSNGQQAGLEAKQSQHK